MKAAQGNLSWFLNITQPFVDYIDNMVGPTMTKAVSWSDPTTVIVVIFIVLSPFALIYISAMRCAMVKLQQMTIKQKNILYVIAHPDDEAM